MQLTNRQHIFIYTFIFWLCFAFPLITKAQTVSIPDANLRAAIEEALGKTSNAQITVEDMAALVDLNAAEGDIRDLTGLETAANLKRVILHHNLVSDLSPLSGLINLKTLDISSTAVDDLSPLAGLIGLEAIVMSRNPPADLSHLSGLNSLTYFHAWGTRILNLSALAELPKLKTIDICGGWIADLSPLEGLTELKRLVIIGNQELSDISPVASLTGLKELDLGDNKISDLSPLADLTGLTHLNLAENRILDVSPLAGLTNLTKLNISHNMIADISPLDGLSEDTTLIYHENPGFPSGGPKIEGPWLWVLVPRGSTDLLAEASDGAVTEQKVATIGAAEGKPVGENVWIADNIAPTGPNNIGEMLESHDLGDGIVYGSATLESPREQHTKMFVGARGGVKIWINGKLVHQRIDGHVADGYHRFFPVTLYAGTNVLLVALNYEVGHRNERRAAFGFDIGTEYTVNPPISRDPSDVPPYDVNQDGRISVLDLILVGQDFGKANPTYARTDVDGNGKINILDLVLVAQHLGEITGIPDAPAALTMRGSRLDPTTVKAWIALAQMENDGSLTFRQGIANLQRLLSVSIPEKTALLANYPNPFNPETWIPYQLSADADIQINIYATNGALIRTLNLGYQSTGIYQKRSRAAYWDGKNEIGEPVSSGIYFYTFTAGNFTATRKMLILK